MMSEFLREDRETVTYGLRFTSSPNRIKFECSTYARTVSIDTRLAVDRLR